MIYVKSLTVEVKATLEQMHKNHPLHLTRKRAQAILLSAQGYSVPMICDILNVCRQTVSTWFTNWEERGLCGLVDLPGRGRPCTLSKEEKIEVIERIKKSPRSLKTVLEGIENEMGITLGIDELKSICKEAGLVWKRVRASLRSKRNQEHFEVAKEEIDVMIQQHRDSEMNLIYFDESGFTLEPCIPYA